jgi:holo-ACP synthase
MGDALLDVLSGREERAESAARLLAEGGERSFVVQITLNIPGYPKRLKNDEIALELARESILRAADAPLEERRISNGAGICWQGLFAGGADEARRAKEAAIAAEEIDFGRVIDADVSTSAGQISRTDLGYEPRRCMVCGESGKFCAKSRRHGLEELRRTAEGILSRLEVRERG